MEDKNPYGHLVYFCQLGICTLWSFGKHFLRFGILYQEKSDNLLTTHTAATRPRHQGP
jgi:hypothetical protein